MSFGTLTVHGSGAAFVGPGIELSPDGGDTVFTNLSQMTIDFVGNTISFTLNGSERQISLSDGELNIIAGVDGEGPQKIWDFTIEHD